MSGKGHVCEPARLSIEHCPSMRAWLLVRCWYPRSLGQLALCEMQQSSCASVQQNPRVWNLVYRPVLAYPFARQAVRCINMNSNDIGFFFSIYPSGKRLNELSLTSSLLSHFWGLNYIAGTICSSSRVNENFNILII